jgi:hypothetical protein
MVNRGLRWHVPSNPESAPAGAPHAHTLTAAPAARRMREKAKKKGRTEARPKFREEKPEGLAVRSGEPARTARSE